MEDVLKKAIRLLARVWNDDSEEKPKWEMSYKNWRYPHWLDETPFKNSKKWLEGKREYDAAEGLWRVHDDLYDLESWAELHPGGKSWITTTKGTDITELFESHHINKTAEAMLSKFHVRKASSPRNSPFTFHPDGFYRTLKARVRKELATVERGPRPVTKLLTDVMATLAVFFAISAAFFDRYFLLVPAAFFLTTTVVAAHNFFHQRDNWRMYYFNLSLMSARDWRVSHAMSHHIYPNTVYDLEVTMFDPFFQWLPKYNKTFFARYISWLYAPLVYTLIFHVQWLSRLTTSPDGFYEIIPFILPFAMMAAVGGEPLRCFIMWTSLVFLASFIFGWIGLNAAHHHPELFHDGDKPREDRDWGIYQLDAVKDRVEVKGNLPLVLTLFGDHSLHHLFPTLDHGLLVGLYPVLETTCKEFNYHFELTTATELIKGQFLQLARTHPRPPQDSSD